MDASERAQLLTRAWGLLREMRYAEARELLEPLPESELVAEPELGLCLCAAWRRLNRHDLALRLIRQIPESIRRQASSRLQRQLVYMEGILLLFLGRLEEAEICLERSLEAAFEAADAYDIGAAYNALGIVSSIRCRTAEALSLFARAMAIMSRAAHQREVGNVYHCTAMALRDLGVYDQAYSHFEHAQRIYIEHGSVDDLVATDNERALLLCRIGDLRLASVTAERACERAVQAKLRRSQGEALRVLGTIAFAGGDGAGARGRFATALEIAQETENLLLQAEVLEELAVLEQAEGNEAEAESLVEESARIYAQIGAPARAQRARERLAPAGVAGAADGDGPGDTLFG